MTPFERLNKFSGKNCGLSVHNHREFDLLCPVIHNCQFVNWNYQSCFEVPVSAHSESQEELLSEILENWQDFITDTDNNDTDFSLAKQQFMKAELEKFKITRNP